MCHSLASEQLLGEQWQLLQVHRHQRDAETCTLIYLPERCSLDECPHFISWTDIKSMKENRNKHLKESQEWKQIDLDVFQCNCPIAYNEPACIHLSHLRKIQTIKAFFFSFFEDVGEAPEHLCLDHSVILKSLLWKNIILCHFLLGFSPEIPETINAKLWVITVDMLSYACIMNVR